MKVALVHDYLMEYGGAERVLEAIHEIWPYAPVYTSIYDNYISLCSGIQLHENVAAESHSASNDGRIKDAQLQIKPSFLQNIPLISKLTKTFTFFMPLVFENMDLREYDVVISDGTIWSKGVLTTPEQLHIHYCHTPPRFLYGYPGETDRRRLWYLQPVLKPLDNWLRIWDFESAQRPDFIIANSKTVAKRIKKFWRRDSKVIYPPVELGAGEEKSLALRSPSERGSGESPAGLADGYYLVVSRLSAYKNVDIAIEACNKLNLPLVVVGAGREEARLKALAGLPAGRQEKNVKFLGFVKDSELSELYKTCKVLLFPVSDEDFGIVPVEAMSFGKPVIALRSGGVQETVVEGKTGMFFEEPTVESLIKTIQQFNHFSSLRSERSAFGGSNTIRPDDCIAQAQKFSKERFQQQFKSFVEEKWRAKIARNA